MTRAARGEKLRVGGIGECSVRGHQEKALGALGEAWRWKRARQQSFALPWFPCRSAERQAEKAQGLSVKTEHAEVTIIPDRPRDSQTSDSDSDGPILYRDEEEDEEEDESEYTNSRKNENISK